MACYSIEQEAKDVLPVVLCICHKLYQATKAMQETWEYPAIIQEKFEERLGQNFMEVVINLKLIGWLWFWGIGWLGL